VLSAAVGEPLAVQVRPDATQGILVIIRLTDRYATGRDTLSQRIQEVMDQYAFAYAIEWSD
jgi:hypothetical protein